MTRLRNQRVKTVDTDPDIQPESSPKERTDSGRGPHKGRVKVGLVHDYLTQFGGAEQVLAVLQELFPGAPTLTTLFDPIATLPGVDTVRVIESRLGLVPGLRSRHRLGLPLFPLAMRDLSQHLGGLDVLIADTSAWAHQISPGDEQAVVVYCHSPARFLYGDSHYLAATGITGLTRSVLHRALTPFRSRDRRAYRRADIVLANSGVVADRLRDQVGVEAKVVYPPVDVASFHPDEGPEPEDWYLVVSRLVPHKRVDLVIETAARHNLRLKIVGTGRDEARLRARAGPTVEFLGFQEPDAVKDHLRRCRAFIMPGLEDFGMTAVEAQAAGRPVIAYNGGGAQESVRHGLTGVLFGDQTVDGLHRAMTRLDALQISLEACLENAARFDRSVFEQEILSAVDKALRLRRG